MCKQSRYIISFNHITGWFFITNKKDLWWNYKKEFRSYDAALEFIKNNAKYFIKKRNQFAEESDDLLKNTKFTYIDRGNGEADMIYCEEV